MVTTYTVCGISLDAVCANDLDGLCLCLFIDVADSYGKDDDTDYESKVYTLEHKKFMNKVVRPMYCIFEISKLYCEEEFTEGILPERAEKFINKTDCEIMDILVWESLNLGEEELYRTREKVIELMGCLMKISENPYDSGKSDFESMKKLVTSQLDNSFGHRYFDFYSDNKTFNYSLDTEYIQDNRFKNNVIFLMGYPGSGKGTQGKILSQKLNTTHLSTGELFRNEVKKKSDVGKQMSFYMDNGEIIPKELTFNYLYDELGKEKYRNGVILDGYPKNLESLEFILRTLKKYNYKIINIIYIDIPRNVALERLCNRLNCSVCDLDYDNSLSCCRRCGGLLKPRSDDSLDTINKRLDVFERDTLPVLDMFSKVLTRIDGVQSIDDVTESIMELVKPVAEKSTVFHNHIDAENEDLLVELVNKIELSDLDFQNKIYRVKNLLLGPQYKNSEFKEVYQHLPNFHSIEDSNNEAFSTGKMGNELNYDQVLRTLEVCFDNPGRGIMTEIEEDIYSVTFDQCGFRKVTLDNGETPFQIDWDRLPGWKSRMIENVPKFELHHSVDIPKYFCKEMPIPMELLRDTLVSEGFDIGGLFMFDKEDKWAYRMNQFSNESYEKCLNLLDNQFYALRKIVDSLLETDEPYNIFYTACSLEKVHAIWKVD